MPKEWQFIATAADGKVKEENTSLVRRTAMRAFRRNERLERIDKLKTEEIQEQAGFRPQEMGPNNQVAAPPSAVSQSAPTESALELRWRATLVDIGPAVAFDPFVSTTLHSNREHIEHFIHFVYRTAVNIQPLGQDVTKNPFSVIFARNALADPLILSAILYHASIHHNRHSAATLFYHGETVRQVAQQLDDPDHAASDSTIAAVGLLAATGNITGDVGVGLVHWDAVQRLIKMRGGLQALGWDGALAMILSVSDVISATITLSKPRLESPAKPLTYIDPCFSPLFNSLPFASIPDVGSRVTELDSLIRSISQLTFQRLEPNNSLASSTASVISYTQVLSAVEHRLLSLQMPSSLGPASDIVTLRIIEIARIAALLSTSYYFRTLTIRSASSISLHKHLHATALELEHFSPTALDPLSLKLHLWSLWIGGITARDQERFASQIHQYMACLNLWGWKDLETFLRGYVITPRLHDLHGSALWQRVSAYNLGKR